MASFVPLLLQMTSRSPFGFAPAWLFTLIISALYVTALVLFAMELFRGEDKVRRLAQLVFGVAVVAHAGMFVMAVLPGGPMTPGSLPFWLSLAGLGLGISFFALTAWRKNFHSLGFFLAALACLLFLPSSMQVGHGPSTAIWSRVMPIHIAANTLGFAFFALAFAIASLYLLSARQLRQKSVMGMFRKLPPLDVLERIGFRLLLVGYPLFTLGVLTGFFWAFELAPAGPFLAMNQVLGLLAWLVFSVVILLRSTLGWRGRRAAIGTVLGFAVTGLVLIGYLLRDGGA